MDLTADQQALVSALAQRDGRARQASLPGVSRWRHERFVAVRESLIDAGWLVSDRHGMTLTAAEQRRKPEMRLAWLANELDLEPYVERIIHRIARSRFDVGRDQYHVEHTARAGRAETGGKWTRPDFTLVTVEPHRWFADVVLSTIEVKLGTQLRVDAVHEALAQRARAHAAWIITDARCRHDSERFQRIHREARTHGIGFAIITKLTDDDEQPEEDRHFHVELEPTFHKPDPDTVDDFLHRQFQPETRQWLRDTIQQSLG